MLGEQILAPSLDLLVEWHMRHGLVYERNTDWQSKGSCLYLQYHDAAQDSALNMKHFLSTLYETALPDSKCVEFQNFIDTLSRDRAVQVCFCSLKGRMHCAVHNIEQWRGGGADSATFDPHPDASEDVRC